MSTQQHRRLKERGGGGGKITSLPPTKKTLTPPPDKPITGRKSFGKENPNPNPISIPWVSGPGVAQKPVARPMAWSMSQPRGRTPSPCDFSSVLSDMRRIRGEDSGLVGKGISGFRGLEKKGALLSGIGVRKVDSLGGKSIGNASGGRKVDSLVVNELKSSANGRSGSVGRRVGKDGGLSLMDGNVNVAKKGDALVVNELKSTANGRDVSVGRRVSKDGGLSLMDGNANVIKKVDGLVVNELRSTGNGGNGSVGRRVVSHVGKDSSFGLMDDVGEEKGRQANANVVKKVDGLVVSGWKSSANGIVGRRVVDQGSKDGNFGLIGEEKEGGREGMVGRVSIKGSASKLQEKLAYLEGKVKRIAGDIKKTKEMLDMNNTDGSKAILSDIQAKISGIEKAVGNVIADSDCVSGLGMGKGIGNGNDSLQGTTLEEENRYERVSSEKVFVKGLSCQELEARLFPHHKLLRNRDSSTLSDSDGGGNRVYESDRGQYSRANELSGVEDDPIALQFLASLNKVQSEIMDEAEATLDAGDDVQDTEEAGTSTAQQSSDICKGKQCAELDLQSNEKLEEFDENKPTLVVKEEMEEESVTQILELGRKTATAGWFVSEGEAVLLAHDDSTCSLYDVVNSEEKAEYRPPTGISQNMWRDCWIVRAPGADGCSGKYVVAASAGNTMDSGFCSWDFYNKDVRAFHIEDNKSSTRVALGPLPDNLIHRRNTLSGIMSSENRQWWYRPCGPLIISTASFQRAVKVFDIRDGEKVMKWDVQRPVTAMDYSSPLQWRNKGKVVIAEAEAISLWDVSSVNSQALLSVSTSGRRISALHVNNTDGEIGGGVRQRVSSTEADGNDGVFCTADSVNILDFRQPSGIGFKIPRIGTTVESVSSRGDSIFLGCSSIISATMKQVQSQVLQYSLRKQKIVNTYNLPESNAHSHYTALTQVWENSDLVMAVCGLGLFVFDTFRDGGLPSFVSDYNSPQNCKEIIGPDDLYSPSFDYHSSQILLISRDRPAMWRQLS